MSEGTLDSGAWVAASAETLNEHGSWTGRIHMHKLLFVADVLELAKPPFEFVLYDYGPYSFDLDAEIIDAEMTGVVARSYPKSGYGPRYTPTLNGKEVARSLPNAQRDALRQVARCFGGRTSQDLELIATCLWMERREAVRADDEIVEHVRAAKPKYDEQTIEQALHDTRKIAQQLKP